MIDIFKQFIINNPDKVLGTIKETTDRFGNPDIIIQGGLENLELIDVSSVNVPNKNVDTSNEIARAHLRLDNAIPIFPSQTSTVTKKWLIKSAPLWKDESQPVWFR